MKKVNLKTTNARSQFGRLKELSLIALVGASLTACGAKDAIEVSATTTETLSVENSAKAKNVLFILVDDLGIKDLGVEGSTFYETPNVDALAKKGVRFTSGYAASQVCSPSRASVLTGKYVTNHGITTWIGDKTEAAWRERGRHDMLDPAPYSHQLKPSEITIAEQFKAGGYDTFFAGKWHLGGEGSHPEDHGFNTNVGGWDSGSPKGGYFSPYNNPVLTDGPSGESLTLRLARETAGYIAKQNGEQPFFAFLSFYAVHAPIQTSEALWKKYRDKAVQQNVAAEKERFKFDRRGAVLQIQDHPIFAGLVESMDSAVGIVLDALRENGLEENTIVVFTSDNGGLSSGDGFGTSTLPYRGGKGRQWEGGIRVPYYIYAPGMAANGSDVAIPASGIDLYPTLIELAEIAAPASTHKLDGISLAPLLAGGKTNERPLYWHYPHYGNQGGEPSSMIREGDWKLIYYHEDQRLELYNLANDEAEQQDVSSREQSVVTALKAKLDQWLIETDAKFPTANPEFDAAKRKARFAKIQNTLIHKYDERLSSYLEGEFDPKNDWWGSSSKAN